MERPAPTYLTQEAFFNAIQGQNGRWELVDGEAIMMAGASQRHNAIAANTFLSLGNKLRGGPCRPTASDTGVAMTSGNIRYPDIVVDCGKRDDNSMTATEPRLIVEVLSPTTRLFDSHQKLKEYQDHPDIRYVLLIDPDEGCALLHHRADKVWVSDIYKDMDAVIDLPDIGTSLALRDIYEGIELRPKPVLIRRDLERVEKEAFERLKTEITHAFAMPESSYAPLTAAQVIARNRA